EHGEEDRFGGAGGARLDVQRRERQPERGPERGLRTAFALRQQVWQVYTGEPAGEREQPRGKDAISEEPDERADQGQVQRAVLVDFGEPAPEVWLSHPALRDLDAHGGVAVVLVPEDRRQEAGGRRDADRDE